MDSTNGLGERTRAPLDPRIYVGGLSPPPYTPHIFVGLRRPPYVNGLSGGARVPRTCKLSGLRLRSHWSQSLDGVPARVRNWTLRTGAMLVGRAPAADGSGMVLVLM